MYIGSAVNLHKRHKDHSITLRLNKHHNRHLQAAYNKYGKENIVFEILEIVNSKSDLKIKEQIWIDKFKSADRNFGYNLSPTASSPLGVKHSEETKAKLSEVSKNRIRTSEWSKNISIALTGKKATETARQNISISLKGRRLSDEHISNRSDSVRKLDKWPCFNGYYCTCVECKAKKAENMRQIRIRKAQKEKVNGS